MTVQIIHGGFNHILVETSEIRFILMIHDYREDNHKHTEFVIIYDNTTHSLYPVGFCLR